MEYRAISITLWFFAIMISIYALPKIFLGILGLFVVDGPHSVGYVLGETFVYALLGLLAYWMIKKAIKFWRDADMIKYGPR
jgi:hypothetical protein